ncbi:bifunctional metallophosphatase/5'-nucleotidase [Sphingomonas sp. RB56-2]|uniref:Bifunctional metallophosphatase/5'-nucleotidase n=1 Tax=Sphingomonas brevis TaxID=2908206 RepID=A0ABT0S7T7_9SPHN|nr:bifunctional metallophosphatase/5'-nucleotidase [Sphingomonas brevis]MCL6740471.1 bifunctional metallophosphatase/5'-nucleotidase [Sphingomonas brevis]
MKKHAFLALVFFLAACATTPRPAPIATGPVEVQILAINDFHGNLEPPNLTVPAADGAVPAGGAAYLANALKQMRTPSSVTVAAGDLIGASPITSALFLDEPTIKALSMAGLDLASVGNHEFDKGSAELLRMQKGGCEKHTNRKPCAVERFTGAGFQYLAANVVGPNGQTLFPATAIKQVGGVRIGFIGMTLKETRTLVSPSGVTGLKFTDEAATANALVPDLKSAGASTIVLLIHQGGSITGKYDDQSCPGLAGDILPILARLDPAIQLVVSGHTHNAYICRVPMPGGGSRLLTSSGKYGALITDIRLTFDRPGGSLTGDKGNFIIVQGEPIQTARLTAPLVSSHRLFAADPEVAALVKRYHDAAAGAANRPVGRLAGAVLKGSEGIESQAAALISDGQLFVARDPGRGNADFALMNNGGARTDLMPAADGAVTFGQIFAMQPFANNVVTKSYTGAEIKAVLEQQFASGTNSVAQPNMLTPSANFRFSFDKSRAAGQRIVTMTLDGRAIDPGKTYRVAVNNFLASGGDNYTLLAGGSEPVDAGLDLDVTEAYLATNPPVPELGRITDLTPKDWVPPKS